jgi:transposase
MIYIGIDLHKQFFQAAKVDDRGQLLSNVRYPNSEEAVKKLLLKESGESIAVIEADRNWMWLVDRLEENNCKVVLAHPLRLKAIYSGKNKTDKIDALKLANLLRGNLIPESYIMPKGYRDNRELIRTRQDLVKISTLLKNRVHDMLEKKNYRFVKSDLFGIEGRRFITKLIFSETETMIIDNLLGAFDKVHSEIKGLDREIKTRGKNIPEVKLLMALPGIGITTAFLLTYEIGDINRFPTPKHFTSYLGLVPSINQSADHKYLGRITKLGNPLVRWSLVQTAHRIVRTDKRAQRFFNRLSYKTGRKKAIVAVARKLAVGTYFTLKLKIPADLSRLFGNPASIPG